MRTIIAGSRSIMHYNWICSKIDSIDFTISVVLCGLAEGVDILGEKYAKERGIAVNYFPADWNKYGAKAGFLRNRDMANNADALIAFWDGKSKGTKSMINIAKERKLIVKVYQP